MIDIQSSFGLCLLHNQGVELCQNWPFTSSFSVKEIVHPGGCHPNYMDIIMYLCSE